MSAFHVQSMRRHVIGEQIAPGTVTQKLLSAADDDGIFTDTPHVGVTMMAPGSATDDLRHEGGEFVYVAEGRIVMRAKGRETPLEAGDYLTIPTGCWHAFTNESTELAVMLFAFARNPESRTSKQPAVVRAAHSAGCDREQVRL